MSNYIITKANCSVPLTGQVAGTPWSGAAELKVAHYPWYTAGQKQDTAVRMLYDAQNLYVQFNCRDRHIFAKETRLNGMVCTDSCVEFFATIDPAVCPDYFNLEINCCGVMHMGYGAGRHGRKLVSPELANRLAIVTSEKTPTRKESPADEAWWVAAAIPFDAISEFTGKKVMPTSGTTWKANFYRCGGKTDDQYACWNLIQWEKPDFHRPEFFGDLQFA